MPSAFATAMTALTSAASCSFRPRPAEHIQLVTDLTAGLPPVVADPGQLEQVVVNLAVNARDAMAGGGTLSFRTDLVTPRDGPVEVRLTVADTGEGMPPDVRAQAFEPFFTTKPTGAGTGLGLATVHAIVAQAGGRVDRDSEVGQGTSVKVYLPPASGKEEAVAHHDDDPGEVPAAAGQTILVVEDEPGVRESTARMLSEWGYRVVQAGGPAAALEMCRSGDVVPDLVVSDVVMPGMGGADLAAALAVAVPGLPVVFMSGYSHEGVLDPDVVLVEKPFTEEQMLRAVGAALAGPRPA